MDFDEEKEKEDEDVLLENGKPIKMESSSQIGEYEGDIICPTILTNANLNLSNSWKKYFVSSLQLISAQKKLIEENSTLNNSIDGLEKMWENYFKNLTEFRKNLNILQLSENQLQNMKLKVKTEFLKLNKSQSMLKNKNEKLNQAFFMFNNKKIQFYNEIKKFNNTKKRKNIKEEKTKATLFLKNSSFSFLEEVNCGGIYIYQMFILICILLVLNLICLIFAIGAFCQKVIILNYVIYFGLISF